MTVGTRVIAIRPKNEGFILLTVLWVAIALALMAAGIVYLSRTDRRLAQENLQTAEAKQAADAGITRGIVALLDRGANPPWRIDGTPQRWSFAGIPVQIRIEDELGKIDLNTGADTILHNLLVAQGLDEQRATALVDAIADWRSKSGLKRLSGANAADYRAAGYSYGPRQAPFESVDELGQVMGMNAKLLDRVGPFLTVFSQRPIPDPNTAPPAVLAAMSGSGAPQAKAIGSTFGTTSSIVDLTGRAFTIIATARIRGGAKFKRTTVVRFIDNAHFWIQDWR